MRGGVEGSDIPSGGCFPGGFVFFGGVLGVMGGFRDSWSRVFFLFPDCRPGCIYFFATIALLSNIILAKYLGR